MSELLDVFEDKPQLLLVDTDIFPSENLELLHRYGLLKKTT